MGWRLRDWIDLDFAEEGIEVAPPGELNKQLSGIEAKLNQLAVSFNYGKLFNSTLNMAIVGQPNVGKSSLLNAFVGEERAITSHTPGTTRDTLHENVIIGNIFFKLIDTAGLRLTNDNVELMGIERTKKQITSANIVLHVIDGSKNITESDFLFKDPIIQDSRSRTIVVINKSDLGVRSDVRAAVKKEKLPSICVSAKNGDGISDLNNEIVALVSRGYESFGDELVITNARHRDLLDKSVRYIARARAVIEDNAGFELAAVDLRDALNTMGEISGETATDDILNQVFANFCIGK